MASTSSSCPDTMQLRKKESSVPMDDIPIAEMKKLEVHGMCFRMGRCDIKMNQRQQQQQQHSESSIPADFPNDAEMVTKMNPELYKAVKGGKIEYIQESAGDVERSILLETSPKLNTILHVAASSGHDQLVQKILDIEWCRKLVTAINSTGDLALHVAANAGHLSIVKLLVSTEQLELEDSTVGQLWKQNKEGNTPLHLALINKYRKVDLKTKYRYHELASFLVEKNPKVSTYFRINKEGKSPLYLAAEAGDAELVNLMIKKGNSEMEMLPGDGKSIVHAAIYVAFTTKKRDVLDTVLRELPDLIKAKDEKGMTPLSYAASIGYLDGVQCLCLLDKSSDCAYEFYKQGFFPVHTASRNGRTQVIEFFLKEYPQLSELLNIGKGQNMLHVAAMSGKAKVVAYMLKRNDLQMLINEKDKDGNTPLHLASKGSHPRVVSILTWDKRVSLKSLNNDGKTALDIAWNNNGNIPSFRERLTWQALRYAGAPQGTPPSIIGKNFQNSNPEKKKIPSKKKKNPEKKNLIDASAPQGTPPSIIRKNFQNSNPEKKKIPLKKKKNPEKKNLIDASAPQAPPDTVRAKEPEKPQSTDKYKDRVNTLLLVATLVATVTFAAASTMPGGYNGSGGVATFIEKRMFQVFVICNTIAMYSAITVVVALIWAQLDDLELLNAALKFTVPILGLALTMVCVAFMAGNYLVLRNLNWLAYLVLIIG